MNGSDQVKMNETGGWGSGGEEQVTTPSEKREDGYDELGARVFERLTNQSRDHL